MSHFTVTKKSFYELFVYLDDKYIYKYSHYQRVTEKNKKISKFLFYAAAEQLFETKIF